jgi:hypothetical protein
MNMRIFNDCLIIEYSDSVEGPVNYPCTVKFDENKILVEYKEDGEFVQYKGKGDGNGHYKLKGEGFPARATLHQFPDDDHLEGSWFQEGSSGMWKVQINE